jgi:hypothetical protein
MSRLYYEKPRSESFKESGEAPKPKSVNDYLDKVATLVPSEVIAGYLTMMGFVGSIKNDGSKDTIVWIILAAGLILTPLYLNKVADPGKPKRNHLILSTIAFAVWATATTGEKIFASLSLGDFDPAVSSIVLVLFSLVSAIIPLNK